MDPFEKFQEWWRLALEDSPLQQKSAVCLSTLDAEGFPSGRFVDLKRVDTEGFIFTTDLSSPKGQEIAAHAKVGMTIWWDHVDLQVRLVGPVEPLEAALADELWQTRSHESRLTTISSQQSRPLSSEASFNEQLQKNRAIYAGRDIPRPTSWSGFRLRPRRLEFFTFREDRLHIRELFTRQDGDWQLSRLQP